MLRSLLCDRLGYAYRLFQLPFIKRLNGNSLSLFELQSTLDTRARHSDQPPHCRVVRPPLQTRFNEPTYSFRSHRLGCIYAPFSTLSPAAASKRLKSVDYLLSKTSQSTAGAASRQWGNLFIFHFPSLILLRLLFQSLYYNWRCALHCAASCRVGNILHALYLYKWTSRSGSVAMEWLLPAIQSWIYEKSVRNKAISGTDAISNGMGGNRFSTNWQLIRCWY